MVGAPITTTDLIASATCDVELFMLCKIKNIFIMNTIMDTMMNTIMDTIMETKFLADLLRA